MREPSPGGMIKMKSTRSKIDNLEEIQNQALVGKVFENHIAKIAILQERYMHMLQQIIGLYRAQPSQWNGSQHHVEVLSREAWSGL